MTKSTELSQDAVKTDEIIGVDVKNNNGDDLGKIHEIILDKVEGQVRYVVLSYGGILGIGDKLFALPWKSINYDEDQECFILDVNKEKLENAPGFDKDRWPDFSDKKWEEEIFNYYDVPPYWKDKNN